VYRRTLRTRSAVILFHQECANIPDVTLSNAEITPEWRLQYLRVVNLLKETDKPMTITEIKDTLGVSGWKHLTHQVRRCVAEGLIRQTEDGYVVA